MYPTPAAPSAKEVGREARKDAAAQKDDVASAPELLSPSLEETENQWEARIRQAAQGNRGVSVKAALLGVYQGLSARLVEEMLWTAGFPASEQVATMGEDDYVSLYQTWRGWLWAVNDGNFVGTLREGYGLPGYSVIPWPEPASFEEEESQIATEVDESKSGGDNTEDGEMENGSRVKVMSSVSECVAHYYEFAELQALRKRLLVALQNGVTRQRAKLSDFQMKLSEAADAPRWKLLGNALAANQHLVKYGMKKVEVPDWEGVSEQSTTVPMIEVELDPKLNAADNAARLFKKYKKLVRQESVVQGLLDEATKSLMELVEAEEAVRNVPYSEGAARAKGVLEGLEQRLVRRGVLAAPPSEDASQAKAAALREERAGKRGEKKLKLRGRGPAPNFLRFRSPSGYQVVAGRSSRQNDRVTWGLARDRDLWFHARSAPWPLCMRDRSRRHACFVHAQLPAAPACIQRRVPGEGGVPGLC